MPNDIDCSCDDTTPSAQGGSSHPLALYLTGLDQVLSDGLAPDSFETMQVRYSDALQACGTLTKQFSGSLRNISPIPEERPFEPTADALDEAARLLEKAGELADKQGAVGELEEIAKRLEDLLNGSSEAVGGIEPHDDDDIDPLTAFAEILAWLAMGFGPFVRSGANGDFDGKKNPDMALTWIGFIDAVNAALRLFDRVFLDPTLLMPLPVPQRCPFVGTTTYCRDFYRIRLSCTPAWWQRIVGGVGGPSGLYHITCRWMVARRTKTIVATYRTRWDRFLARRACTSRLTTTWAWRTKTYNHFKVGAAVPAALPGPFQKAC